MKDSIKFVAVWALLCTLAYCGNLGGQDTKTTTGDAIAYSTAAKAPDYTNDKTLNWHDSKTGNYAPFYVEYYDKEIAACSETAQKPLEVQRPWLVIAVRKCTFGKNVTADDVVNAFLEMERYKP